MIDGLVISFVDINRLKNAEQMAHAAYLTTAIVNTVPQPLLVLDEKLNILTATPAFNQAYNPYKESLTGQSLFTINESAWDCAQLRNHLTGTLASNIAFEEYFLDIKFPVIGEKRLMLNGRILKQSPGSALLILLAIEDISGKTGS